MVKIIKGRVTAEELEQLQEEYLGYIKVVADLKRGIIVAGGEYHVDDEQILIADGSQQCDLWGGGYDVKTKDVDFFALSNFRPAEGRVTYEIADPEIQQKFRELVYRFFSGEDAGS